MQEFRNRIGQLFVLGFKGAQPPRDFLDFIAEEKVGGVILFGQNCASYQMAADNIALIRSQYDKGSMPFIAVDQEGGRVSRLRKAPAEIRSAADYANEIGIEKFAEDFSRAVTFLESLGFNLNLAPVADIELHSVNPCLKDRCYGQTSEQVAEFVKKAVSLTGSAGMLSCLKHFPGLGAAVTDPHTETPVVDYDELIWRQREMIPFAAGIEAGADMIMTTHMRMSSFNNEIVTGSSHIIDTLLRTMLNFDGPVITDDLTMGGASPLGSIGERTVKAFNAGHDLLLFGPDHESAMLAYDYFVDAFDRGEIDPDRVKTSLGRVSGIKFKLDSSFVC